MKSRDIHHGVYMAPFGLSTIVMASQSNLEWHMNKYRTQKDESFLKGLLKRLEYSLPLEDKFFDSNPHLAVSSNQRWKNFCDDCVILATLSAYLNNSRVVLIHPDSYNPSEGLNTQYEMPKKRPTFIEGIEIQQLN
ncbi:hypothetical protein [Polynucleobacter sp. MWH-Aus1W21]|jgi:hypothetical protein|uniref:hypothetical protein n=1 Tax=Polynucleobacter sp. MWH-Aus1W21 TaxID=1855880 RepID=UPI001BFE3997|nr:hypothetical protein [Polynucleobacter sp. MWH-Aus1W21]QWD65933.1 hypothetical protein ICW03_09825 [Polynucleobacter sp. MWH-Aus1W21]